MGYPAVLPVLHEIHILTVDPILKENIVTPANATS